MIFFQQNKNIWGKDQNTIITSNHRAHSLSRTAVWAHRELATRASKTGRTTARVSAALPAIMTIVTHSLISISNTLGPCSVRNTTLVRPTVHGTNRRTARTTLKPWRTLACGKRSCNVGLVLAHSSRAVTFEPIVRRTNWNAAIRRCVSLQKKNERFQ
jgi:hypothetical protein